MAMTPEVETVHWGTGEDRFALTLPASVAPAARDVFGPWRRRAGATRQHWYVVGVDEQWQVHQPDGTLAVTCGEIEEALTAVEYGAVLHLAEQPPDRLTFHAALLGRGQRGLLIHGPPLSGKTTLACYLWHHGWDLLGDDVTCVDPQGLWAWPAPRRVSVRPASEPLLGEPISRALWGGSGQGVTAKSRLCHPAPHRAGENGRHPVTLAGVVFLGRSGVDLDPAEVRPMHEADALMALLPAANLTRRWPTDRVMRLLRPIAEQVPAIDLGRGELSALASAAEELVGHETLA